jgi:hypothetical protein
MKRTSQVVAGGPTVAETVVEEGSPDVAGASTQRAVSPVALSVDGSGDVSDAALREEFAEFLSGDGAVETLTLPVADPIFRERLRRRLWQIHLLTLAPGSQEPN